MSMTKSKKFVAGIISLVAIILSVLFLCSCGIVDRPWNRTLEYCDISNLDMTYTIEGKDLKLSQICEKYFDDIDWQGMLGKTKEEVGTGSDGFKLLYDYIIKDADLDAVSKLKFQFGSEDKASVTINGNTYKLRVDNVGYNYEFEIEDNVQVRIQLYDLNQSKYTCTVWGNTNALPLTNGFANINFVNGKQMGPNNLFSNSITVTYWFLFS